MANTEFLILFGYLALSYLVGAIPTGYLVVKLKTGEDIRNHGSGNTGATNVSRVAGKPAAQFVLACDFLKGFLPVLLSAFIFPGVYFVHIAVGILTMIGHSKSIFLGFSGGKSAITGLATLFAITPVVAVLTSILVFTIFKITRTVSIGTLSGAVFIPTAMFVLQDPLTYSLYGLCACAYVAYLHKENIKRLMEGKENKL